MVRPRRLDERPRQRRVDRRPVDVRWRGLGPRRRHDRRRRRAPGSCTSAAAASSPARPRSKSNSPRALRTTAAPGGEDPATQPTGGGVPTPVIFGTATSADGLVPRQVETQCDGWRRIRPAVHELGVRHGRQPVRSKPTGPRGFFYFHDLPRHPPIECRDPDGRPRPSAGGDPGTTPFSPRETPRLIPPFLFASPEPLV